MTKEQTDRIRESIAKGYQMGGCFIDAIRDDLLALLQDNELAYHYAQKFQRELLEHERELLDAKALIRRMRDHIPTGVLVCDCDLTGKESCRTCVEGEALYSDAELFLNGLSHETLDVVRTAVTAEAPTEEMAVHD
jgi:hypothetical protein